MRAIVAATLVVAFFFSGCSSVEFVRYRACLSDGNHRTFRTGWVTERRADDGALRFQFDDPSDGDHGFMWVTSDDPDRRINRCEAASPFGMDASRIYLPKGDPQ